MTTQLDDAVRYYDTSLVKLEQSAVPSAAEMLAVLVNRDHIQKLLMQDSASPESLLMLLRSDKRLRSWVSQGSQRLDFASWRDLVHPDKQAWWWFLDDAPQLWQSSSIKDYEQLVNLLEEKNPTASFVRPGSKSQLLWTRRILKRYLTRDQLQKDIENGELSAEQLAMLSQLDHRFRCQLESLPRQVGRQDLAKVFHQVCEARRIINPSSDAWWWFFKIRVGWSDRLDFAWNILAIVFLAISFSLFTDIVTRFLSVSPGILGGLAIIGQIILTIIGGGSFTDIGRQKLERILEKFNFPERSWQEVRLIGSSFLLMTVIGLHFSLPRIAQAYNDIGYEDYANGYFSKAELSYQRAIALNPSFSEAHYNLGLLYEDLQNYSEARTEYALAVKGRLLEAYNNWARLEILEGNYLEALTLLQSPQVQNELKEASTETRYVLLKNAGWALQELEFHEEAIEQLRQAVELAPNRHTAYCLLAKSLEPLGYSQRVFESQKNCRRGIEDLTNSKTGYLRNPEEYLWILEAGKHIQSEAEGLQ